MKKKPYVICVGGGTCSGKSTLTAALCEKLSDLSVRLVNMDTYFIRPPKMTTAPITGKEYPEFNHPDALDKSRMFADFRVASEDETLDVLMIEGLFALQMPELYERADLRVFVDLKSDERLVRRIKRHLERGDTYDEITSRYLDTVRFRHEEFVEPTRWRADLVLNGTLAGKETDILETYIRAKIGERA